MCIRDSQSIFARSSTSITASEKSSIITNRKSTTGFPMSLRWTAYVALSPPIQRAAQKRKVAVFCTKVNLSCKISTLLVFRHRQRLVQSIVWPTPSLTSDHPPKTDTTCSVVSLRQLSYLLPFHCGQWSVGKKFVSRADRHHRPKNFLHTCRGDNV